MYNVGTGHCHALDGGNRKPMQTLQYELCQVPHPILRQLAMLLPQGPPLDMEPVPVPISCRRRGVHGRELRHVGTPLLVA